MRKRVITCVIMGLLVVLGGCDLDTPLDGSPVIEPDQYEPDDVRAQATSLPESANSESRSRQEHTLHSSSDIDWFSISVSGVTGNLYITIEPVPENATSLGVDNIGFVVTDDSDAEILASPTSFGNSTAAAVKTGGTADGIYYIRVFSAAEDTGVYQISWYTD